MAGTIAELHVDTDVCADCLGTCQAVDDGELTGVPGTLVPCICVPGSWASCGCCPEPPADACACWVGSWSLNDGHTGWVPLPLSEVGDGDPLYRACTVHAPAFASSAVAA
jgi:hypothetical protein